MPIANLTFQLLHANEVNGFFHRVMTTLNSAVGIERVLGVQAFNDALDCYRNARARRVGNKKMSSKDVAGDRAWQGLNMYLRACMYHYDESKLEDAAAVKAVFDTVPNPTTLNYDEEYGALSTLLDKMNKLPAEMIENIGATPWIDHLKMRVAEFYQASDKDAELKTELKTGEIKEARKQLLESWQTVKQSIEYMADIAKDADIQKLEEKLNVFISAVKKKLSQRSTSRGNTTDGDASGDIQFDKIEDGDSTNV